jgi:2,3-bisphosphoglycerate-dependent phosphoglycerate mutase
MAIGFQVGSQWYEAGAPSFLNSFFSSVVYHLEDGKRGIKYPLITKALYLGSLNWDKAEDAIGELRQIKDGLKEFTPDKVIWDMDDLSKRPPWGDKISKAITDLSNYYVTSDGKDFFEVLFAALQNSLENKADLKIQ